MQKTLDRVQKIGWLGFKIKEIHQILDRKYLQVKDLEEEIEKLTRQADSYDTLREQLADEELGISFSANSQVH